MTGLTATILIVDDKRVNRRLLEAMLRPEGYETRAAANGAEALAMIELEPPDLILLDVMMPEMDGHEVARRLKSDPVTRNIPIIMVTARTDRSARLTALAAGAEDFLIEPVDRAELYLRVRNLLRLKAFNDHLQNHGEILETEVRARTADLQRFRTAMDAAGEAIFLVERPTMRFVEVNATACLMSGYSRAELLALGPCDLQPGSPSMVDESHRMVRPGVAATETTETLRRKDGSQVPVEVHRHAQDIGDDHLVVSVMRDITERAEAQFRLRRLAHYDALTGLPNRTMFHDTLGQTLKFAEVRGLTVAVLFVDLDHFKNVNDTLGHATGDELLVEVSRRLASCVRIRDMVGRLGGDEFALILPMENGPEGASAVAAKIQSVMRTPFNLNGHELTVTASIGITTYPDDALERDTLIRYADTAMYQAKHAGRDTFRFFTARMNTDALARLDLEIALRRAIKNEEFVLHYQPKVHLDRGNVTGLEALLRWERPGHGLISPGDFIPVLEDSGLIVEVGRWVIRAVCAQIAEWMASPVGQLQVSVNVSARQFVEGDLEADVIGALEVNEVPAHLLELELTETSLMANTARTVAILQGLKDRGVHISIDDFGTGYSSLAYLRRFPIDKLKIDISFVRDITANPDAAAIAVAIIQMAHTLNLDVIAEGVETAAQREYLRRHHCDQMQGYYFCRPLQVVDLERLLHEGTCLPQSDVLSETGVPTLLLVDEDPEVHDQLQRLFVDDGYRVLHAQTAEHGLEQLALNEVHVILCDRPTAAEGERDFLGLAKELHPRALRIVLSTSFGGEDALIATINHDEVHRYFKKPWDDLELRRSLRDAFRQSWRLDKPPNVLPEVGRAAFEVAVEVDDRPMASVSHGAHRPTSSGTKIVEPHATADLPTG